MFYRRSGLSVGAACATAFLALTIVDSGSLSAQESVPIENGVPHVPAAPEPQVIPGIQAAPSPSVQTMPAPTAQTAPVATGQPSIEAAPSTATSSPNAPAPAGSIEPELAAVPRQDLPHNLSPIGMFLAADIIVKAVMLSLAFASLLTWTIWLAKTLQIAGARARTLRGLKLIGGAQTLAAAIAAMEKRRGVVSVMLKLAADELRYSDAAIDHAGGEGVKERVGSTLGRIEAQAGRRMAKGTGVLATIGSTAPFVGLFGTVWGIMNAFIGISESQTTNLAVVAPGIAEALLATAIGLVAAIPAVIIYNVFARSVTAYRQLLADAAAAVERLVSRDLDFRKVPGEGRHTKIKLVTE